LDALFLFPKKLMDGLIRAVKSDSGEWVIEILGVPFGSPAERDSDGEFFTASTKFHLDKYPTPPLLYYHSYKKEDGKLYMQEDPIFVGKTTSYEVRSDGIWWRGVLDKAVAEAKKVWDAISEKAVAASSGSIAHVARKIKGGLLVDGAETPIRRMSGAIDGQIMVWPVAELSVFDTSGGKNPANKKAVVLQAVKAVYDQAGLTLPDDIENPGEEPEAADREAGDGSPSSDAVDSQQREVTVLKMENTMDPEEIQKMVADSLAAALKAEQDRKATEEAQQKAVQVQIATALKAEQDKHAAELAAAKAEAAAANRLPGGYEAPYVTKFDNLYRFDDLSIADLAVTIGILDAAKMVGRSRGGASEDARRALAVKLVEDKNQNGQFNAAKAQMRQDIKGLALKANELNQSTLSSYGDEWIGVTYSTELWRQVAVDAPIMGRIPTVVVPQGSESIVIPLESTAPVFYKVAQASAQSANPGQITETVTTSRVGTSNTTLTVAKLGAADQYTGELEEDSLIQWAPEVRRRLNEKAVRVLEHIGIDGDTDTSATTNINSIGGTPSGNEAYLLFNGFRKLALVTNTANSRSAGTLAVDDYLETVKLMGLAGTNAIDRNAVLFVTDLHTHWLTQTLTEVKTQDVFSQPTMENGILKRLWGYEIVASPYMHWANQNTTYGLKANTSGKVDLTTVANNTTGSILAVRPDQWRLGYKRRMTFEIERSPRADATSIVCMMRVGMINRDTEASAISYNVTLS
jgi:hypothetical protein